LLEIRLFDTLQGMYDQPLLNEIDLEILMHKDAHFGGSFTVMIEYYGGEGVGIQEEFDLQRIKDLAIFDKDGHLSAETLPDLAKNDVFFSKELYKKFRDCYEGEDALPKKLADLVLSESDDPEKEIIALSTFQKRAIKPLVEILLQDHFYNPLNPGYGRAPINAALSLKKIGNTDAIPYLFGALGKSFTVDEILINTLISFGKDGEEFLYDRLKGTPYTKDNYLAAMALSSFPVSDETAELALSLLTRKETFGQPSYASYLICICEGLENDGERKKFIEIANSDHLTKHLASEMKIIITFWNNSP
jgi:hypothetical protein